MICDFSLRHYREILQAARSGGYRFRFFDHEPQPGDLLLRHDVDLSLDAAIRMAELEAQLEALARLRELEHAVGLHAVRPHLDIDARFDPVVAWHNPEPETMSQPLPGLENVMGERFFRHDRYRSDSNGYWRSGCPHEALAAGELEWLQLLVHPEIWVYPGATMRETMLAMLESERARDLERFEADRIDLT
jgi:hypothetical protein